MDRAGTYLPSIEEQEQKAEAWEDVARVAMERAGELRHDVAMRKRELRAKQDAAEEAERKRLLAAAKKHGGPTARESEEFGPG